MSESLRSVLIQEVKARFPAIDWNLGSVVRELVIEPLSRLGDLLESRVAETQKSLDVKNICAHPTTYPQELSTWADRLGLTPPPAITSTGTVRVVRTSPGDLVIPENTAFSWGGEVVAYTTSSYHVCQNMSQATDGSKVLIYKKLAAGAYSVDIPVSVSSESGNASLSAGAPLNWVGAPDDVYDIYVGSALSGSAGMWGVHEMARAIEDALTPNSLSGEACLRKALRFNFPALVKDVVVGDKDINYPHAVTLYIKPVKCLQEYDLPISFNTEGVGRISACGVYRVLDVYQDSNTKIPVTEITYGDDLGNSKSEIGIKVSSRSKDATVRVLGFPEYAIIDSWLQDEAKATPFEFVLKTPAIGVVNAFISVSSTVLSGVATEISAEISDISLNHPITDADLDRILGKYSVTRNKATTYSVRSYVGTSEALHTMTQTVSPSSFIPAFTRPLALYSQTNLIEILRD